MSEEELDKSVEEFAEAEKKPIEVYTKQELSMLLKHFYWE